MRRPGWIAERVDMLKQLWADGATAQAIAERLGGVSRSAVMGKVFRLRLNAAGSAGGPASAAPPWRRGKTLLELTNRSCRWPLGEPGQPSFLFCGVAGADLTSGMPYCARHARLAYGAAATICASIKASALDDDSHPASSPAPVRAAIRSSIWRAAVRRAAARRR